MLTLPSKPTLDEYIRTCTPLYRIPALEATMRTRVANIVRDLLAFTPRADPVASLTQFLQADPNFLGVLLALTNLSQERFLRILTAERFAAGDYGTEWSADRVFGMIKRDEEFAKRIARLFLEGKSSEVLVRQVAEYYLQQLSLPHNWQAIIRDESVVKNIVRRKLAGEYADRKGAAIEAIIESHLDEIATKYGFGYEHGQVRLVGKEVDHAIPTLADPYVMIMTSYLETTSSNQTQRANEQQAMYEKIIGNNVRYGESRALVNVVDGGGWLARRSDLRKLYQGCDYCLNLNMLSQLEAIVCKHVPARFFTAAPRPKVQMES